MLSVDLRAFRDPLLPLRQRREWELDAALARAGQLRAQLAESRACQEAIAQDIQVQAAQAVQSWRERGDPVTHARLLAYLAQLHTREHEAAQASERLAAQVAEAQALVMRRQRDLEALRLHREAMLQEFRVQQARKLAAQADQDWSAGTAVRQELAP